MQSARPALVWLCASILLGGCEKLTTQTADRARAEQPFSGQVNTPDSTLVDNVSFTEPFPSDGVVLGQGWNSLAGRPTMTVCVSGTELRTPGGSVTADFRYIFDREQFEKTLDITASASYSGFGVKASVSSTFNSFNSSDKSRTNILGRVLSDKGATFLVAKDAKLALTVASKKILEDENEGKGKGAQNFFETCGDSFVSTIRLGGTLGLLFTLDQTLDKTSEATGLTVSASGFGASANLSVNQKTMKELSKDDTQVRQYQTAGNLDTPTSATEAVAKIARYATYDPATAIPYQVTLTPYSLAGINARSASNKNRLYLKAMFWQYQRLMDLASLYNAAVLDPTSFYTPFSENLDVLARQAAILTATTRCLEPLLAMCRDSGQCGFDQLSSANSKSFLTLGSCPLSGDQLSADEKGVVIGLLTANDVGRNQMVDAYVGKAGKVGKEDTAAAKLSADSPILLVLPSDILEKQRKAVNASGASSASAASSEGASNNKANPTRFPDVAKELGTFDFYYQLLATAPMRRNAVVDNKNAVIQQQGDELKAAMDMCKSRKASNLCAVYDDFTTEQSVKTSSKATTTLSDWVLLSRLAPLSQAFCSESLSHPLCKSPGELHAWTPDPEKQVMRFGPSHGFIPSAKAPEPPPRVEHPPPPFRDPCDRPQAWRYCR